MERHANEVAAQKLEEFQQEYELGKDAEFIVILLFKKIP